MSKYIIELDENAKEVVVISLEDGDMWTETMEVEDLEQLNSDYINEHFGDLQDDAYNKGYAQCQDDYGDALKHAKDTAYKKGFEDGKAVNDKRCVGCKWEGDGSDHSPCDYCCNCYSSQWTAKDDKPIIGEVVERYLNGKRDGVGMFLGEDGDYWNCLFWTGAIFGTFAYPSNQFKRTGNVCDITKILEAMKHD